jgi:hypothetical protein
MNIFDIALFPDHTSLLLTFDWLFDGNVKRLLSIHFISDEKPVAWTNRR